ncbi:ABC transporter permease [Roseisolibacter sp. H3M3-2]|uniref:ABC transporter permease n=1 Tax=Roseisolibacter sp. H3M3-2 TaxID=3031323 RepID=UPI0023DC42EE|nr:ABC transporter permease [Roseisolibacter sp. H3M3-2]MDF1503688.1 ABC transporter permease [Roseisolibacter sp. H3M3-2]
MRLFHAARARLRLLFARRAAEARMDEEFRFHLDMEADRLARAEGLAPAEARRRAVVAFGLAERHRDAMRDGRGLAWLGGLSLDLKLGFRMLVKYPGLTIVGGLAMAFAICVGAVVFETVRLFLAPALPLPQGDRIVHLRNWDVEANRKEPRALHDLQVWRQAMRSVTDLGAWQDVTRNLVGRDGEARPLRIAAITASGFRVAATPPLLGRAVVPADERADAPPVVVLGHEVWRLRFAGDSGVVGRTIQLGDAYATVVGVMPSGFAFPVTHDAWMPLRPEAPDAAPRAGPAVTMFGRLAPGATLDDARAELAVLGRRAAREQPATHRHLQPQVMPYAQMFGGAKSAAETGLVVVLTQVFTLMLLVLVCGNVALLLFARAATRESEIVVRSALGASRRRIVLQLFAEALVLGGVAAAAGLGAAHLVLRHWGLGFVKANFADVPFWFDPRLSPATALYAGVLTVLGAAIAGGLPGRKVTRDIGTGLRSGTSGGGARFGGVWTAVIVAQVAVTVAFPGIVMVEAREQQRVRSYDVGFAADEYLAVRLDLEAPPSASPAAHRARFATLVETLRQRVAAEPGVVGVTFADRLPRTNYDDHAVALDEAAPAASSSASRFTKVALVDPSYFGVLGAPILAGRGFRAADAAGDARVVVVDQGFVDRVLQGRNPIGRRVRLGEGGVAPDGPGADSLPWLEIVGLVRDLGMIGAAETTRGIGLYRPAAPGDGFAPQMVIHTQGEPMALVPRVRALAAAVDPTLRVVEPQRLDGVADDLLWMMGMWLRTTLTMTGIALLLSLSGIYAVLTYTVARRTREIGVRVALGAPRRTVVAAIFRRPLTQVGLGIAGGAALIAVGAHVLARTYQFQHWPRGFSLGQVALLVGYAAGMLGVCLLACVVPTRRALRVQPMTAMRVE